MGTIINAVAVVVATLIGIIFKKRLPEVLKETLMFVLGLVIFVLALGWFLSDFLVIEAESISTSGELLVLASLVIGTLIGTKIDIDGRITRLSERVEHKYHLPPLAKGFVAGTLIFCVGALAILGPIYEVVYQDITLLLLKSMLDFVTAMMLATVFGIGVAFAALSVLIYQGAITLLAVQADAFLTPEMWTGLSMVGNIIIIGIGINFMKLKQVKVANMLPSLLIPIIYYLLLGLFSSIS